MNRSTRTLSLLSVLLLVAAGSLSARAQLETARVPIENDPAVRTGVLENGLTYYVLANDTPSGMAELRLIVRAGSILEDEDQLGLAHFTEHMLFNGTKKYPEHELVETLESFGMDFGPDINAYTTFDQTIYRLSVRTDDGVQFPTGLEILEEWAFNATLSEEEFEKERMVIYEEWRVGRGAQARMLDESYPVLFADSRYAERRPIGDMEIVLNAPVETLRRFYDDWYRPDLMAVVAVGDFDPDETVDMIRDSFGKYDNPENARTRQEYTVPSHDDTLVSIVHDEEAVQSSVQLFIKRRPEPQRYREDVNRDLAEQIFFVMLNRRFSEMSRQADPPFLYGYGFDNPYNRNTTLTGLAAAVAETGTLEGLDALVAEVERVKLHGFLPSELERAKADVLSYFESYWKQRDDMESRDLVYSFIDAYLMDETYPSVEWQWDAVQEYLPRVTLDDVNAVADYLVSDGNRVVIVNGPSVPAIADLRPEEVLAALDGVKERKPAAWEETSVSGPLVSEPAATGAVVAEEIVPDTDILSWTLSNGARVLVKSTDFRTDELLFRAVSPGGSSLVEDGDYVSARFATDAVEQGGLGIHSLDNLRKVLTGKNVEISPFIQETYEGFSGQSSTGDVETLLQLVHLYHSSARRDETAWNALMNRTAESLRNRDSSPMTLYSDQLWETIYNGHFRSLPITLERLGEADLDEALAIFTDRFDDAGDFTYVFVGDVDPEVLKPLVEKWLAGLPSGDIGEGWADRGMRNSDTGGDISMKAGLEPLGVVTQVWFGEWDGSFTERYRMQSLASALEMHLTKIIREEFGGTYSVSVYPHMSTTPYTDYRFFIRYSCDPDRVEELSARVLELVDSWRTALPEARYASDIAASQNRSLSENLERNSWWMGQIVFAVATGTPTEDLMDRPSLYDTLTPELLSDAANDYLDDGAYLRSVLYPAAAGTVEVTE